MISCQQASRMLSDAMEHRLTPMTRLRLRLHLAVCRMCRAYAQDLRILQTVLAGLQQLPVGPEPGLSEDERTEMLAQIGARIDAQRPS